MRMSKERCGIVVPAIVLTASLIGCSESPQLNYVQTSDFKALGPVSKQVLLAFEEACPAILGASSNLKSVTADVGLSHPRSPEFGWHKGISIQFVVADQPTGGELWQRAAGHTCFVDAGGGKKPGFSIDKPTCASLCNGSPIDSLYWPTSRTQELETKEESEATEKQRIAEGASATAALEKQALQGDYQAQRNLAYGLATGTFGSPYDPVEGCAWYGVVVMSGSPRVDSTDHGNVRVYCGKLSPAEKEAATQRANDLLAKLQASARPK